MAKFTPKLNLPLDFLGVIPFRQQIAKAFGILDTAVGTVLTGSKTFDFASVADGEQATTTVTVTGAALGDFCQASVGVSLAGALLTAYVSAANTVTVVLQNKSGAAVDLASTTLRVLVRKA